MVHRVDGPIDTYRGHAAGIDQMIAKLNQEFADVTVFQSEYSLRAHRDLAIDLARPVVIRNAVDPAIFYPPATAPVLLGRKVRVVSTSWSANPNKGGPTHKWLERNLDWERYEFTFVGRSSVELERARSLPPRTSSALAHFLRSQDVYLAASLHDPSSNALLEALACGLPAVFARSGGHPEIVGAAGIGFDSFEEIPEALDQLVAEYAERRGAIAVPKLSSIASAYRGAMGVD
jgi:glycosyltransferase involved in cell wall biosynthesis